MPREILGERPEEIEAERQDIEDDFANDIQPWLTDQAGRVSSYAQATGQEPDSGFWDTEDAILAAFLLWLLLQSVEKSIGQTVVNVMTPAGLGVSDAVNARAAAWAEAHALELAKGLNATTRQMATRRIAAWLRNPNELGPLDDLLTDIISPEWRARMIAQTEVTRAWQKGMEEIAAEYEEIKLLEWVTRRDERVCPICQPLDGRRKEKGGLYPGGFEGPPAHPRCRCTEVFVVETRR